jgi:hypothetical protein
LVAVAIGSVALVGGCSSARSEAQTIFLIPQASSLGRCTVSSGNGGPFDPMSAGSWNGLNRRNVKGAWARVVAWQISSKPKDPPQDRTVEVKARLQFLRGNRTVLRPTVGAFQQDAKSIARALEAELFVFVGVFPRPAADPYVSPAIALDKSGRFAWLGECASHVSDSMALSLLRADVDSRRIGPAVRRWISDGDSDALVRTLRQG